MTNTNPPTTSQAIIHQPGEGEHVLQLGACVTVKLAVEAADGARVSAAEFLMPPHFGPPLHVHHAEDELLQILEGSVRVVCGAIDEVLGAGGFAYLPRGVPHTFWVQSDQGARMLSIFTPGGVERMFVESGVPTKTAHLPDGEGAQPGALDAVMARYDVEFVGSPLGA
ncbi:MAG TPA: cupin domain-containing protein [Solirubrobacteraceae bacterium]|nr:cupin domain-containing protein [Solirubrobacteraceae bacterium]